MGLSTTLLAAASVAAGVWAFVKTQKVTQELFEPIVAFCLDPTSAEVEFHPFDRRLGLVVFDFFVCLFTQFVVGLVENQPAGLLMWGATMLPAIPAVCAMTLEAGRAGNRGPLKFPALLQFLSSVFGISVIFPAVWVPSYCFFSSSEGGLVNATLSKLIFVPALPMLASTVAIFTLDIQSTAWTAWAGFLGSPAICLIAALPRLLKPPQTAPSDEILSTAQSAGLSLGLGGVISFIGWMYLLYVTYTQYGSNVQAFRKDVWSEAHPSVQFMTIDAAILWLGVMIHIATRNVRIALEAVLTTPLFGPGAAGCMALVSLEVDSASKLAKQQIKKNK